MVRRVAIFFLLLFSVPFGAFASADGFLTNDLGLGSEGPPVSLLQSWLAEDPSVYPEGTVSGIYGPATESAVRRFQKKTGAISTPASYGSVDAMTRAALNAEFAPEQGGLAWVRGEYDDIALLTHNGAFAAPVSQEYRVSEEILKTLSAWVYVAVAPEGTGTLLEEDGFSFGFDGARVYARNPSGAEVVTARERLAAGGWNHVSVIFTDAHVIFLVNNVPVEAGEIVAIRPTFLQKVFAFLSPARAEPAPENAVAEKDMPRGFFAKIVAFFSGLADRPVAYEPPALARPSAEEDAEKENLDAQHQKETPARAEPAPDPEQKPEPKPKSPALSMEATDDSAKLSDLIATSTATTTPSSELVATSTATTTLAIGDTQATTTATSTASSTAPSVVIGGGGGGGGGGSAAPAPEPAPNQKPVLTLAGEATVHIPVGSAYTESGATAADPEDGDISANVAIGGDTVNRYLAGTYTLSYNVSDSAGLAADALSRTVIVDPPSPLDPSQQEPTYTLAPLGEPASLAISGSKEADPKFSHADITPLHVYVGQTQTLTVTVSSAQGVSSVTATTVLDNQTLTLNLQETGTDAVTGGKIFSTSWTVFDTHVTTYKTTFTATNGAGQSNSITLAWTDPCSGIVQGANSSISASCTVTATDGLDGGNLTIPGGVTLTLNSGALWAWNSGKSITVTGSIAVNGTATLQKGNLWYSGTTNGTANESTKVFDTASTKTGHMRVSAWFGFKGDFTDQNNVAQNATITSNTITVGDIVASPTASVSGGTMSINGDAFSATSRTISNGQTIAVRLTSSNQGGVDTIVTVTLSGTGGGDSVDFSATTGCIPSACL